MNLNDFMLEPKDIKGRLVPGFIILINLYSLRNPLFNGIDVQYYYKNYTILFFLIVFISSYLLGDINGFISFKLRDRISNFINKKLTLELYLKNLPKGNKMSEFFKKEFGEEIMKENFWRLHWTCRESLINHTSDAIRRAERISTSLNYKINMILPLLFSSIMSFCNSLIYLGSILIIMVLVLSIASEIKKKDEAQLIYLNYYEYRITNPEYNLSDEVA
jgi:hypothetical protein